MRDIISIQGVQCYEKDGVAYLNLEAVARGLGFTKRADSGNEVVNWTRVRSYLLDLGVEQKCTTGDFIPENIFYRLAMKARNETAERFQALIADEVIPAIRKHGGYLTPQKLEEALLNPDTIIRLATSLKEEREKNRRLSEHIEQTKPKVLFAESVECSRNEILIGELAKILKQNGMQTGQNRLFDRMRKDGYLIARKGSDYNMPTQRSMEMGLMRIKETSITHADGHVSISKTPKVTGKGQVYFVNRYAGELGVDL
ncbi:MAG: phage antirepressor KilAC domain-containing protein [Candidatus Limiplasma sp.]|nr:phage antirepressor KilAC domain-containing protein [Candidatus Limiplasma sp.]